MAMAQESEKPVLAFGPWFNKKTETTKPVVIYTPTKTETETYRPILDSLSTKLRTVKRSNSDSIWQPLTSDYQALSAQLQKTPGLERALISDAFMNSLVMQANRSRRIDLSLYFIEEAKRIHPEGVYGSKPNCKH